MLLLAGSTLKCWRIDLRGAFSLYVNGELRPALLRRLEKHLLDCGECRSRLVQVRMGHRLATRMPLFKPERDPWFAIQASIDRTDNVAQLPGFGAPAISRYWRGSSMRTLFWLASALALVSWFVGSVHYEAFFAPTTRLAGPLIDRAEFHEVSISAIARNTEPHVVTEGYVAELRLNTEENSLSFKLVEAVGQSAPFVICEIIDPLKVDPPAVGSRVRVYGVSRYDGKANHQWYEVHPVLNIEALKD